MEAFSHLTPMWNARFIPWCKTISSQVEKYFKSPARLPGLASHEINLFHVEPSSLVLFESLSFKTSWKISMGKAFFRHKTNKETNFSHKNFFPQLSSPLATTEQKKKQKIFLRQFNETPKQRKKRMKQKDELREKGRHIIFYLFSEVLGEWGEKRQRHFRFSLPLLVLPRLDYCYYYFYYERRNNIKIFSSTQGCLCWVER